MAIAKQFAKHHPVILSLRQAMVWLFLFYLRFFTKIALKLSHATIIGIAGAVGKSTTRDALAAILSSYAPTKVIYGNSETGIPLGILGLHHGTYSVKDWILITIKTPFQILTLRNIEFLIVEMGIDGPKPPKNMQYLLTIVKPNIAILLSESAAHIEHYESILPLATNSKEDQIKTIVEYMTHDDGKLLQTHALNAAIINATDSLVLEEAKKQIQQNRLYTVGHTPEHDIVIHHHEVTTQSTTFGFSIHTHQQKEYITLTFPGYALPHETGASLAAAILTGLHVGVPLPTIQEKILNAFTPPPGRCTILKGKKGTTIIDSSYNSSPASMESFINLLKIVKQTEKKQTVLVFGDMKELGSFSQIEHTRIARLCIGVIDHLILVGPLTKQYVLPSLEKHISKFRSVVSFSSVIEASEYIQTHLPDHAVVLTKGSQLLEELIKPILVNNQDVNKLCRQDEFWKKSKKINKVWID